VASPVPFRQPRIIRATEPEIDWFYAARIEPGEYPAYCRSAKHYYDHQFKRWVCAVQFDVLGDSLVEVLAQLTWYLNLGKREKPHAGRRSNYWDAWTKANGGPPRRKDRLTPRVFVGRHATVLVGDTAKNHRQVAVKEGYSVVRDVLSWDTGGPR
jgi:hypothetical protein